MTTDAPVWVLLGQRAGDNNQLLRLADALGLPFRAIELRYNALHLMPPRYLGATLKTLISDSRRAIEPPWPTLVLGIGFRSVPVALAIRKLSGGKSKLARLGNPRLDPSYFDVVITTAQYAVREAPNVIPLPIGIPRSATPEPNEQERQWLARAPRPHRLLLIGGNSFMWALSPRSIARAAAKIAGKGGSLIAVRSPRSERRVIATVEKTIRAPAHSNFPRYPVLLADADEIYVTGDSVAMISDAVATGKPVAIVRPTLTLTGRLLYAAARLTGRPVPIRDIRGFIESVLESGLAGTVDKPIAGHLQADPLSLALTAIRALV